LLLTSSRSSVVIHTVIVIVARGCFNGFQAFEERRVKTSSAR